MTAIRPTAVAGQFYPADFAEANRQLTAFLDGAVAAPCAGRRPKALIAPHAGWVYSGPVAAGAYALLKPFRGSWSRVVLLGPSHRVAFQGMALSSADQWASPLGAVPLDKDWSRLAGVAGVGVLDQAHAQEHSLEVHVPFLQATIGEFTLLPVVIGDSSPEMVAGLLEALWGGDETLIVISTDLSHYLPYEQCRSTDGQTVAAIEHMDAAALSRDGACGRLPVGGLLTAAKRRGLEIVTLDVRNSGDTAGPKDRVVGYGAWALFETETRMSDADQIKAVGQTLLELSWASIRHGLETGSPAAPPAERPGILGQPGAVFVTLNRQGGLRGCIGSVIAWRPLAEDLVDNAFKSAFKDPRFPPLTPEELEGLSLSLSVLTPPVPMSFRDEAHMLEQLRPRTDGLIIEDGGRRALFLPSVWEQLPDKHAFLAHLKAKAGMPPGHWSPSFKASRFQAVEIGK
ncbi:AmmeMemoRadiSam system protein B [Paramagnetospirillum magneticum]|uniref:MEMO1 family protein amb3706 n=1 Tax=Paramagnetospirillum magneticum (strain ATCC 700264 / AMB-1) TaxID=342108 RepID=Q2W0W5_PARM1|nr:AmmeMemoRadiSam system protein B [Paramagnetospirillum magneticum]BAE52510.1 Predicted dioxygenase [Paramagnetospirillum magneticum AMB-1]